MTIIAIESEETLNLLSHVRLGINTAVIGDLPIQTVNELFILSQPAHLQKMEGRLLESEERDVVRAEYIRRRLN